MEHVVKKEKMLGITCHVGNLTDMGQFLYLVKGRRASHHSLLVILHCCASYLLLWYSVC